METDKTRATLNDVAVRAGLTFAQGERFVAALMEELMLGREVRLRGLGTFRLSVLQGRVIDTPVVRRAESGPVTIDERAVIRFTRSRSAATAMNDELRKRRRKSERRIGG